MTLTAKEILNPTARQILFAINGFYCICGIIIIAVAAWAKAGSYVSSLSILGGVIACGVFMLLIGGFGIFGAWKSVKGLLVLYMILLGILFIIQFSISVAALAIGNNQQDSLASSGWCKLTDPDKNDIQLNGNCFGFQDVNRSHYNSSTSNMCMGPGPSCPSGCFIPGWTCADPSLPACQPCYSKLKDSISLNLRRGGGVSLAFAFTELIGLAAAYVMYRGSFEALRALLKLPIFDQKLLRALGAEFVGMTLFVYILCSSVVGTFNPISGGAKAQITDIALSAGLTIAALVHCIGHISGGHLNPAVTFALVLARKMKWFTGLLYVGVQCLGSIVGAALTYISSNDVSEACNSVPSTMNAGQAFLRELILTFLLVFVVFGTIDPKRDRRSPGPLSIGFAVVIAHLAAVTSTGTGINPARSLGPAIVQGYGCWQGHWVFWIGPMLGGAMAGYVYEWFFDWGDDKIISAKEAYTKEGNYEPESRRETRMVREQKLTEHKEDYVDEDDVPADTPAETAFEEDDADYME